MAEMEYELKAALSRREAASIEDRLVQTLGPGRRQQLTTRYFDTPDRALARGGAALRIRRDGRRGQMTVKLADAPVGGYRQSREISRNWTRARPELAAVPDTEVRATLCALSGDTRLEPWFSTHVERTSWRLAEPSGEVEVAIDRGWIRSAQRRMPICEIEFELLGGSPEALFLLAERLLGGTAAWLALPGKADRGAALSRGEIILPRLEPGGPPPIAELPSELAVSRLLGWLAGQVSTALHLTLTDDSETGPHQLRVALRRLRAAVRLLRPAFRKPVARALQHRARAIGRIVSPLRDADVLVPLLLERAGERLAACDHERLTAELRRLHARLRAEVRQRLCDEKATGFAVWLLSLASLGGWQAHEGRSGLAGDSAAAALDRQWRRIRPLGDRLAILDAEARHELRKRLKNFRYGYEFTQKDNMIDDFLQILKKLQSDLGALNDADVLATWSPPGLSAEAAALLESLRAVQSARRLRQAHDLALGRAARHWAELRGLPLPWRQEVDRPPLAPEAPRP